MPSHAGFLQDIIEHPEDDGPRLVYADWLDDHGGEGEATLARFIRVQCRLAALADDDLARVPLEEEEARLRREVTSALAQGPRPGWLAGLPAWVRRGRYQLERGFLARLTTPTAPFLKGGAALVAATPLQALSVTNPASAVARLAACPALGRVRSLNLSWSRLKSDGLAELLTSPHLGNVRELDLARCMLRVPAFQALADAPGLPALGALRLSHNTAYDAGVEALAGSARLAGLTRLELADNQVGPRGAAALARSPHLTRLARLDLSENLRIDDPAVQALAGSGGLTALADLDLTRTGVGPAGAGAVLTSSALPALERLALPCFRRGLWEVVPADHLRGRLHLRLRWGDGATGESLADSPLLAACAGLEMHCCLSVNEAEAHDLARSPALAGLRSLSLSHVRLGAPALEALLDSPHLGNLRRLALPYSVGGDRGVNTVLNSGVARRLTHLDLTEHHITGYGYQCLAEADLPGLVRLRLGGGYMRREDLEPLRERFGARLVMGQ